MRITLSLISIMLLLGIVCHANQPIQSTSHTQDFMSFWTERMEMPEKNLSSCFNGNVVREIGKIVEFNVQGEESNEGFFNWSVPQLWKYRFLKNDIIDLDGDGSIEELTLRDGRVTIKVNSHIIWQTPKNWWVDYFFVGDTNNDGLLELNLIVWKEGSFGSHKPFWIKEENVEVKNHLFVFKLDKGKMKPVWQSSNLDEPNYCGESFDVDGDGENELIMLEGSYTAPFKKDVTIWKWNGWGFFRVDY